MPADRFRTTRTATGRLAAVLLTAVLAFAMALSATPGVAVPHFNDALGEQAVDGRTREEDLATLGHEVTYSNLPAISVTGHRARAKTPDGKTFDLKDLEMLGIDMVPWGSVKHSPDQQRYGLGRAMLADGGLELASPFVSFSQWSGGPDLALVGGTVIHEDHAGRVVSHVGPRPTGVDDAMFAGAPMGTIDPTKPETFCDGCAVVRWLSSPGR
jgi:hypothetical protein